MGSGQSLILHLDHGNYASGQPLPTRLYNIDNDLAKFSKVKAPHGYHSLPTCIQRVYHAYNKSDKPIPIRWKVFFSLSFASLDQYHTTQGLAYHGEEASRQPLFPSQIAQDTMLIQGKLLRQFDYGALRVPPNR